MNHKLLQKIALSFLIIFHFPATGIMETIKKLSYKGIENAIIYRAGTRMIDAFTTGLSRFAIWFIHIAHSRKRKPVNYELFENAAQQTIKNFENSLFAKEKAEFLCNNARLASITRNARRDGFYPDIFFLNHYADLAIIDELYKFPDNLRTYKLIPLQKIKFPTTLYRESLSWKKIDKHRC